MKGNKFVVYTYFFITYLFTLAMYKTHIKLTITVQKMYDKNTYHFQKILCNMKRNDMYNLLYYN